MGAARSQRIREFLVAHPGSTAREIAEAIEGQTHLDVVRIHNDLIRVAERDDGRPYRYYTPGSLPRLADGANRPRLRRKDSDMRAVLLAVRDTPHRTARELAELMGAELRVIKAAIRRVVARGIVAEDSRRRPFRYRLTTVDLPPVSALREDEQARVIEERPVEEDAVFRAPEWAWSRHIDTMLPRDLPRCVREELDAFDWRLWPLSSNHREDMVALREFEDRPQRVEYPAKTSVTIFKVREIRSLRGKGLSYRKIAEAVGLSTATVGRVLRGKYYADWQ